MINFGDTEFYKIAIGDTDIMVYVGDEQIWPSEQPIPYEEQYLTIEITSAGYLKWFTSTASSTYYKTIQYSKDNGTTWTSVTSTNANNGTTINVSVGDIILFKSTNQQLSSRWDRTTGFRNSTAGFKVYGNVMSMIYGDNYIGQTTLPLDNNFGGLFRNCTGLTSAENLVLPATTLTSGCYRNMFQDCVGLISAPELPATSLATYCYTSMFTNCTSITTAPELPATTLQQYCYQQMFINCSNLSYIKCLATDISAIGCTDSWVSGVASSGTFVKNSSMSSWGTGNNGIPTNWTVENDEQELVVLVDNLGNTNNQGYSHSNYYTFDYGVTEITPETYDFTGIASICSRDDWTVDEPVAFLGKTNDGDISTYGGCITTVERVEIDCSTITSLIFPFGNDDASQASQSLTSVTLTNTENIENIEQLFAYCENLVEVNLGDLSNITNDGGSNLIDCYSLETVTVDALPDIDMENWGWSSCPLTEQSIINILDALPTTMQWRTIELGQDNLDKLVSWEGQQALDDARYNKNWNVY